MGTPTDPVYLRVLADLRAQIRDGALPQGARVPSRNAIIARYGVGETAAKHALQVLAAEGLIETRAGSGSYVRRIPPPRLLEHDRLDSPGSPFDLAWLENAPSACAGPGAQDHAIASETSDGKAALEPEGKATRLSLEYHTERLRAPADVARRLRLAPDDERVARTTYLLTADGLPVQLATSYEPLVIAEGAPVNVPAQKNLEHRGVISRMAAIGIQVDQVVEELAVRPSQSAEASDLGIALGAPVISIERAHVAGDRVVEVCDIVIPADQYRLRYRIPVPRAE
jgi:GntR family transcriptional regulator